MLAEQPALACRGCRLLNRTATAETVKQDHGIVRGLGGEDWIYVESSIKSGAGLMICLGAAAAEWRRGVWEQRRAQSPVKRGGEGGVPRCGKLG